MNLKHMDQRNEMRESLKATKRKLDAERAENTANKKVARAAILAKNEDSSQASARKKHIREKLRDDLGAMEVKDTTVDTGDCLKENQRGSQDPGLSYSAQGCSSEVFHRRVVW